MKKRNESKMTMAALMMMAAMAMTSCASSKKINGNSNAGKSSEMCKNEEDLDNSYLVLSDAQQDIVKKNNAFALRLFNKVTDMESKVISPMSVSYLMGMLANGADGITQQEILKAIGCEGVSVNDLNELYKAMLLNANHQDKQTTVNIANYIAVNKNFKLNKNFSQQVSDGYQAGIESLDFTSYLMNAIYFKGTWQNKFNAKDTKLENFRGYTRDIQKVEMMHQVKKLLYAENKDFKAVDLPYGNGSYRMLVLLPNEGKNIQEMMKGLDEEKLNQISQNMENCMVNLKLPKFTIEQELPLNAIISDLGAPSMFVAGKANFSHFADGNFFVSKMLQKAKIEVNEQGTKAAAVTAAVMLTAMAPEETRNVEFIADRPFVYMIQDSQSGGILFMGQYCGTH